jgi:hypothetical protein
MQKTQNKKNIIMLIGAILFEIVLILNPFFAFAAGIPYDSTLNITYPGDSPSYGDMPTPKTDNISIKVNGFNAAGYQYALFMGYRPEFNHVVGMGSSLINAKPAECTEFGPNPNSVLTTGASPAKGFCAAILSCHGVDKIENIGDCRTGGKCASINACTHGVATAYNNKIISALQKATDAKISSNGLDSGAANAALESCAGDLSCVNNVLAGLQGDSAFAKGTSTTGSGALTTSSLSDLVNSFGSTSDTGPLNSATNDQGGILGKNSFPKVDVMFRSEGISQSGSKMIATAVPGFFNNASDPKKLYFTWYLKREGCELGAAPTDRCDLDFNGKITENDWKIAAAKIIVSKSFNATEVNANGSSTVDYTKFPDGIDSSSSAYTAFPEILNVGWRNDFLRDGGGALYQDNGGNDNVENCYVQAPKSGRVYELRKTIPDFTGECPENYHRACVSDQKPTCPILNPAFSQAAFDAANSAIPKIPYLIPISIDKPFDACAVASEGTDKYIATESNPQVRCGILNDTNLKNFKANVICSGDGQSAICLKNDSTQETLSLNREFIDSSQNILGIIVGSKLGTNTGVDSTLNEKMCTAVAKPDAANSGLFLKLSKPYRPNEECGDVVGKVINGIKNTAGGVDVAANPTLNPKCTMLKGENVCKHLFPRLPGSVKNNHNNQAVSGDGEFNLEEKKFWQADPTKASTINAGKDEANVVGLGIDTFEWMYSTGDKLGVVVEGESTTPSEHPNVASNQRTWAFSKGTCAKLDELDKDNTINNINQNNNVRGFYIDGSKGILTAKIDLNDCLAENLLDPTDSDGIAKLKVNLNYAPENPINDVNGKGDILTISSSSESTSNANGLVYKWSVQKSRDGSFAPIDTTNWVDITSDMQNGGSFLATDVQGLDKTELPINLNIDDAIITSGMTSNSYNGEVFYLRVKLKIIGTAADGSQSAIGITSPIRVKQQNNELRLYPVTVSDNGLVNLNKGLTGQSLELCSNREGKQRCYVTKNQILGLEVPTSVNNKTSKLSNFSWSVNNNPISCSKTVSSECSPGGNVLFMPVLGNEGEAVDVVVKAINEKNEQVEVSRHFVIVKNQLQILGVDPNAFCGLQCLNSSTVCPKYLGFYKDLNGGQYPDCSNEVLQTSEGNLVTLQATGQSGFDWSIDGQVIPEYKDLAQIQIPINKVVGESYNIGLSTHLSQTGTKQATNTRLALYKNWGISPEDVIEENQRANVQIDVIGGNSLAVNKNTTFGASLITHLPTQLLFLLKISLTSVLMFLITGLLFAVIPETLFKKEELRY